MSTLNTGSETETPQRGVDKLNELNNQQSKLAGRLAQYLNNWNLEDLLILHQVKEELIQLIPLISQLFEEALGLVANQTKSGSIPQQRMEFLGFLVDTVT